MRQSQQGAVLVIALVLMSTLALLAVSALQSAALDLAMSGNEDYRARALRAAQAGVEDAVTVLRAGASTAGRARSPMPGTAADFFTSNVRYITDDATVFAASGGTQTASHYTVSSRGTSLRHAAVAVEAGLLVVRDLSGIVMDVRRVYWKRADID